MVTETSESPQKIASSQLKIQVADLPDLKETFADSINSVFFDGQSLRIAFGVTRFEGHKVGGEAKALRYPACRMVLTPAAAAELMHGAKQLGRRTT